MNKDQIKGKIEEIKGDVKKRIGGATDDPKTQTEGWLEEKKGQVRGGIGDVKDELNKDRKDPDRDL